MRKNYMVMLVVFIMFGMFQGSLYSYVESQIEGVIVDDETGQPLKGAYIELISGLIDIESSTKDVLKFDYSAWDSLSSTHSDKNGRFQFKDVSPGKYFLQIFMDGYSVLGPFLYNDKGYDDITFWHQYTEIFIVVLK